MRKVLWAAGALAIVAVVGLNVRADDPKPIKDIMEQAHKQGLRKKVLDGKARDDEKKTLLALYEDLAKNKPPQGDEGAWKKKTEAIVKAAKSVSEGNKAALKTLTTATDCKACHKDFKPE